MPITNNVMVVGDPKATDADCPGTAEDLKQIWIYTEHTDRTKPSTLQHFGGVTGWQEKQNMPANARSLYVLPDQNVELAFFGITDALQQQVLDDLKTS
jgi:hypothetical protein